MDYNKQLKQLREELFSQPTEQLVKKSSFVSPRSASAQILETEDPLARIKSLLRVSKDVAAQYKKPKEEKTGFAKGFEDVMVGKQSAIQRTPSLIPRPISSEDTVENRRGSLPSFSAPRDSIDSRNSDGSAVDQFVDQIIQVESGGKANAKNPRSSATGLGQFISSTWMNMVNKYRPDVAKGRSKEEVLALRNDPDLSREMTRNYTRENEDYLSSKGHNITPGNLYLAHFLGPGGANKALSANGSSRVVDVMGKEVVSANPFLANYTISDLISWSDRKMRRK